MKDYYYFLGLQKDATDEEIRRAYRKLSLKYHPDFNKDDEFFEKRFREIQEAYETLTDAEKRRLYDQNFESPAQSKRSHLAPVIKSFSASKIRVQKGDEIVLNWETENADLIKILPFGLEKASGERIFKITEFQNRQFHAVLQATNTLINKSVVQGITFTQVWDAESVHQKNGFTDSEKVSSDKTVDPRASSKVLLILLITIIIALVLLML